ncbi:NUDIX domain-containing protein [bacterium]|nr:NUDIX domain-containing protein [bacterium]
MSQRNNSNIPASYLILIRQNKILLLRRHNTGYQDGQYSTIAGHVEEGESFSQCIIREAKEEAGITLKSKDIKSAHIMHRKSRDKERVENFFIAQKWEGKLSNMEPHKCDDLSWFALNNLPQNTIPYIRQAIKMITDNVFYSEFGWSE